MFSYPESAEVLDELGTDFVRAFGSAVEGAREDITGLRDERPSWFPNMAPRTLANLIHDRIWCRLVEAAELLPDVTCVDSGSRREVIVGSNFVMRIKRHRDGETIASYPTQTALQFYTQIPALPGMERIPLALGYRWDSTLRQIGAAVLSLRDGHDNVIWSLDLELIAGADVVPLSADGKSAPALPTIGVASDAPGTDRAQGASSGPRR